jgi:ubiquitin carboxyl-terminal hydrolase 47
VSDYLRCRRCKQGRSHFDTVLDLSLVIKPWGSTKAFVSIEEALQEYVRPEVLDGDNCVECSACGAKTPHDKGLSISEPPYLLQLQLKRFVFNPFTEAREKLNDRVTFPLVLDLNPFVEPRAGAVPCGSTDNRAIGAAKEDTAATALSASGDGALEEPSAAKDVAIKVVSEVGCGDDDGGTLFDDENQARRLDSESQIRRIPVASNSVARLQPLISAAATATAKPALLTREEHVSAMAALVEAKGPHIYELYSVLVHSGTANGGHYYAYIMVQGGVILSRSSA